MNSLAPLEYIVAVDTHRHFAKAAETCFVTQPTLSMQIKKLENELNCLIFDRSKQPVIPTQIGEKIIAQAKIILQEAEKLPLIAEEDKGEIQGNLRIGIIPTIAPYLLPRFSSTFHHKYPKMHLELTDMVSEAIITALHQNTLDVGILVTPLHEEGIFEMPLYYEEMLSYMNPTHPLSKFKELQVSDLKGKDIWLLNDGHCFKHQVVNFCHLENTKPSNLPFEFIGGSIETLIKIVDKDGGYTLIPELAAMDMPYRQAQIKPFAAPRPLREVSLIYTRKYQKIRLINALASTIKQSVPQNMWKATNGEIVEWRE